MKLKTLDQADLNGKRILVRLDLNVPLNDGQIQDDTRIQAALPTLKHCLEHGASLILMTHLGRPKGEVVEKLKTDVLIEALERALDLGVSKVDACVGDVALTAAESLEAGEVLLLENTRFYPQEKKNDPEFAQQLAELGDLYINDAFGAAHRAHASTEGITHHLPSYAGLLMQKEVEVLSKALESPSQPVCLLVGGAKIDTKIGILDRFLDIADSYLIGGALANTFIAAEGHDVGSSLWQEDKLEVAKDFLSSAHAKHVCVPTDVVVANEISNDVESSVVLPEAVSGDMKILDIGTATIETFRSVIAEAGTVIWNGPMGLYEFGPFENGTKEIVTALAESKAEVIVGGGDSIDALKNFGYGEADFSHISTGGGAMLEFLEGKELPALATLKA